MKKLILQLHITGKCNLRCKHCYIDEHSCEMTYETVEKVLHQFEELAGAISKYNKEEILPEVHLTGGEPFVHSEIHEILDYFIAKKSTFRLGIMSNGTLLGEDILEKLQALSLDAFQVSIDGVEETHDRIRGKGNFAEVLNGLDKLHSHGIPTRVSFTANRENFKEFPEVVAVCREHHVSSVWSDRFIPIGEHVLLEPLTKIEMKAYVDMLQKEFVNVQNAIAGLRVENYRALQFLGSQMLPYYCKAGERLIVVDEHGDIMPCRRMPIVCGNVSETTLLEVYSKHPTFLDLRKHRLDDKCKKCVHGRFCRGGSRCMAYATSGNYSNADPCCFL